MLCCSFLHQPLFESGGCGNLWATDHKQTFKTIGWLGGRALNFRHPKPSTPGSFQILQRDQQTQARERHRLEPAETKNYRNDLLCSGFTEELLGTHRTKLCSIPKICTWTCCCTHTPPGRTFTMAHAPSTCWEAHIHTSTHISHCFLVPFKTRNLSCRAEIIMTGRNGLKCCFKSAKSLLCRHGSGLSFLSSFTSSLGKSAGKLTCKWNKQICIHIQCHQWPTGRDFTEASGSHLTKGWAAAHIQKSNKPSFLPKSKWLKHVSFPKVFNQTSD